MANRPLKPFQLAILVALSAGEDYAYSLASTMMEDVQGSITIRHRDVYRELNRLTGLKLVSVVPDTYPRRFRLTQAGHRTLIFEQEHALRNYQLLQRRL
jgi:DNA-binding PadR family transcriptional regulator